MYEQLRKELEDDEKWDRLYWCEEQGALGFMATWDTGENCYWNRFDGLRSISLRGIFSGNPPKSRHICHEPKISDFGTLEPLPGNEKELIKIIAMARLIDPNCPWKIAENIEE